MQTRTLNRSLTLNHDYQVKAGEILLYDEIGFFGITAKQFKRDLDNMDSDEIVLRINSPGGDVFDGMAIFNAIRADRRPIRVEIDGLAASAASFIALAGDSVAMAENAFMMIHDAWGLVVGNAQDMIDTAQTLEKIDGQIAAMYAAKSGGKEGDFRDLMDAETWFTAAEAKDQGLIDASVGETSASALFDLSVFRNTPHELKRRVENDLREAGYSITAAKAAVSKGFAALSQREAGTDTQREVEALGEAVRKLNSIAKRSLQCLTSPKSAKS